jgi:uncharacterized protein YndB with AHSA1/START domain
MARIVFEIEIEAAPEKVVEALDTEAGIAGWWTPTVTFPGGGVGSTMRPSFSMAPVPFELRVDQADGGCVRWASVGDFPPHWAGTEIIWTLAPTEAGTRVHFSHAGWADDEGLFPNAALTWGSLMHSLKQYVETGVGAPLSGSG